MLLSGHPECQVYLLGLSPAQLTTAGVWLLESLQVCLLAVICILELGVWDGSLCIAAAACTCDGKVWIMKARC